MRREIIRGIRHTGAVNVQEGAPPLEGSGGERLAEAVARYPWYHTLELAEGVVTPGMFDHRPAVDRYLLPPDLSGMRCLDVGTMDGFWAFEMERRGAAEVLASDVRAIDDLDWPPRWRDRVVPTLDRTKAERFRLAHAALRSSVKRIERSVYDLDRDLGTFDLVFCGDLLVHLKDPVTAIQRMRLVCSGSAIVCNPVKRFALRTRRALVEFDGIDEFRWWLLSEAALERMMLAAGFTRVECGKSFRLPSTAGGKWKGTRAVVRGFVD
jgi:tRNA (mo5U34)-methyltransferase